MQNLLYEEKNIFCMNKYLYTINNLCVVIEIIASYVLYCLKSMSRNTLSAPQADRASQSVEGLLLKGLPRLVGLSFTYYVTWHDQKGITLYYLYKVNLSVFTIILITLLSQERQYFYIRAVLLLVRENLQQLFYHKFAN